MPSRPFEEKVVIVTGSSNGIGRATVRLFAEGGARVTITGRNDNSLKTTRDQLLSAGTSSEFILEILGDLTEESFPEKIVKETVDKFGRIDVLVNNAGTANFDPTKPNISQPVDLYDYTMNLNVRSIVLLAQHAIPHLEKTHGAIVNVSSVAAYPFTTAMQTYYSMSKSALDQLTVQLAGNLILKGIRVNSVNPGIVATDILQKAGISEEHATAMYQMIGSNRNMTPIGRTGSPDDIGKVIVFLADRGQSEFIVGQRIAVDGGAVLLNNFLSANLDKSK